MAYNETWYVAPQQQPLVQFAANIIMKSMPRDNFDWALYS